MLFVVTGIFFYLGISCLVIELVYWYRVDTAAKDCWLPAGDVFICFLGDFSVRNI